MLFRSPESHLHQHPEERVWHAVCLRAACERQLRTRKWARVRTLVCSPYSLSTSHFLGKVLSHPDVLVVPVAVPCGAPARFRALLVLTALFSVPVVEILNCDVPDDVRRTSTVWCARAAWWLGGRGRTSAAPAAPVAEDSASGVSSKARGGRK